MNPQQLIADYGYYAGFIGSLLKGETVLVMAGFAAHRGYLDLPWVMVCAAGGFLGDQFCFYLGWRHGGFVRRRIPFLERHAQRVNRLLMRYDTPVSVLIHFIYGLRTAGLAILGMSKVAAWRFAAFNFIGAVLWAALVGGAGCLFGRGLEAALPERRYYDWYWR